MEHANHVTCPSCGFPNSAGASVCLTCKKALAPGGELQVDTVAAARPMTKEGESPKSPTSSWNGKLIAEAESAAVVWLWCDPLPPIPVTPLQEITIGRSAGRDLTLPHNAISRTHAIVQVEGEEIQFSDNGSFNGSYLNGKRVEAATLRVGDILTLGPYDIVVRAERAIGPQPGDEMEGTQPLERIQNGMLEETPLTQTLQDIEFNQKTGTLKVISGDLRGSLGFRKGRPLTATLGDLRDDEAVLAMLALTEGRFVLSDRLEAPAETMDTTITRLMFQHARRRDEETR